MTLRFHRQLGDVAVISFDLDDTLYDNLPILRAAEEKVQHYIEQQYPQTRHWDIAHWRARRMQLMQRDTTLSSNMTLLRLTTLTEGFSEAGVDNPGQAADDVMQQFHHHRSNFKVPDSVHQLLNGLRKHFRLCAISNGNVDCARIGLAEHFDIIVQPQEQLRGKPHPDMFEVVLKHYQIAARQLLHIGDHPHSDILGAHRAGCQSGWFRDGLGNAKELSVVPTFSFDNLNQLLALSDTGCTYSS